MAEQILSINAGSSSIKFAVFEADDSPRQVLAGQIERIGFDDARIVTKGVKPADDLSRNIAAADQPAAVGAFMDWLNEWSGLDDLGAAGHRIVHGGPIYGTAERLTPQMLKKLRQLTPFDPQHLPAEISLVEAVQSRFPQLPSVACFDTAFHHNLPRVAQLLAIPRRYAAQGVRRYGFHGLSYEYLMRELARIAGSRASDGRVILAHLGNGASLSAVHHGAPLETSMGFTPAAGVPMSTRSGDLDPGLFWYLSKVEGLSPKQYNDMINLHSGLLGVSETSSDMRELLMKQARDVRAAEAVALFCYQVKKHIGAFSATLGGVDTLIFSGGIGEKAAEVRLRICEGLEFLGIELDQNRNAEHAPVISLNGSSVTVRIMHTDEEWMIAKTVCQVLKLPKTEGNHDVKPSE